MRERRAVTFEEVRREWAINYLRERYVEQNLAGFFSFEVYKNANLETVIQNIGNGLSRRWNLERGVRDRVT